MPVPGSSPPSGATSDPHEDGTAMSERDIFMAARGITDPAARASFLTEACGDDLAMRKRVERLLRADGAPDSILDVPAVAALLDTDQPKTPPLTPNGEPDPLPENGPDE